MDLCVCESEEDEHGVGAGGTTYYSKRELKRGNEMMLFNHAQKKRFGDVNKKKAVELPCNLSHEDMETGGAISASHASHASVCKSGTGAAACEECKDR